MEIPDKETVSRLVDESFIFKSLERPVRERLRELANPRFFKARETLIREDEEGLEMMIVVSGLVEVSQLKDDGDLSLAQLGPGAVIGEVSVITQTPRTSTVTAVSDTVVLSFSLEVINDLIELYPRVKRLLLRLIEGRAKQSMNRST